MECAQAPVQSKAMAKTSAESDSPERPKETAGKPFLPT
jgi:hypothetical protein